MAKKQPNHKLNGKIRQRLNVVRKTLAQHEVPAYLVTNRMDGLYLTGFTGEDSAVLITARAVHLITDSRFDESSEQECPWAVRHLRKGPLEEEIAAVVRKLKLETVGIQAEDLTVAAHRKLSKLARPVKLKMAPRISGEMRECKDAGELAIIGRAIEIAEQAFLATCETIQVGQTEREVAARLEYEMQKRGAEGSAFHTIVAEGPNASLPHAQPSARKIKPNSAVLIDWGAVHRYYRSDLTRVVFMGTIPPEIREIYEITLQAQQRAISAIKPGVRMCDVDAVARGYIEQAGYGKFFGHGLGHGLGLDTHEAPSLRWSSEQVFAPGMVVTVEPGIYLPGLGGVRIEDDVLVTENGRRVLTSLPTDLASAQRWICNPG
jgi:Xaa-Pro aminopeptidase